MFVLKEVKYNKKIELMKFNFNTITAICLGLLYIVGIYFIDSKIRSPILVSVFVTCICVTDPWQSYKRLVMRPTNTEAGLFVIGLVCWLLLFLFIVLAFF